VGNVDKSIVKRVFVVILLGIVVLSIFGVQSKVINSEPLIVDSLEPGDILFVDLYEGWCHGGFWDHIGLYIGEQASVGGYRMVVEATYDGGITITSIGSFIGRDEPAKMSARRLEEMPEREAVIQQVIESALNYVGRPFDYTATATIPLKNNENRLHCGEVVWRAYKSAGIDLDSNGGMLLYPDDIYFSSKLEPV